MEHGEILRLSCFVDALEKVGLSIERTQPNEIRFRLSYKHKSYLPHQVDADIFRWLECEILIDGNRVCRVRPVKWLPRDQAFILAPLEGDETKLVPETVGAKPIFRAVVFRIHKPKHRRTLFISYEN